MKFMYKIIFLFILSVMITSCAHSTRSQAPDKYALEHQLQPISRITNPWISDWEEVDNQSLFIRMRLNEYYLIILNSPSHELHFQETIALSYDDNMLMPGFSSVIVSVGGSMQNSYLIDRIFKVNGIEQMRAIKEQLAGKK